MPAGGGCWQAFCPRPCARSARRHAIGRAAFEVGDDVRDAFVAQVPGATARFVPNSRGRWQADLYGLARDSLAAAGVVDVGGGELCTFADPRFYSHRRAAPCGRMATLIWRSPEPST